MEVRVAFVLVEEMPGMLEGQRLELADSSCYGAAVAPEGIAEVNLGELGTRRSNATGCD